MTLEKSRAQLTRDFESWFAIMERQAGAAAADAVGPQLAPAPTSRQAAAVAKQVRGVPVGVGAIAHASGLQTLSLGADPGPPSAAASASLTGNREADADIAAFYKYSPHPPRHTLPPRHYAALQGQGCAGSSAAMSASASTERGNGW
jgi:hypothetical protein